MRRIQSLRDLPRRLRRFYFVNSLGATVALAILLLANLVASSQHLRDSLAVLFLAWSIPVLGLPLVRRWGVSAAVALLSLSALTFAIGGVLAAPFVAPIGILVLMVPMLLSLPYVGGRAALFWVTSTVVAMAGVAALGEWQRDRTNDVPTLIEVLCLAMFVPTIGAVIAFEVGQLYRDLKNHAGELLESRNRVALVANTTRRTIERDLHDGAQQRLVSLTVQTRLAADALDRGDLTVARAAIEAVHREAHAAVQELRELAQGIYPPILAERGLVPALTAAARRSVLPCTLLSESVGRHPNQVEEAVYFCILEALTNAAKHSGSAEVTVQIRDSPRLEFAVIDHGRGFDPESIDRQGGLLGMEARIFAVGGTLTFAATAGGGTTVRGVIPHPGRG